MKVREKLMRKVMAVVIAAATIFSISGGTKVVPVKAAGEVAEIVETHIKYATFEDAVANATTGQTIQLLCNYENPTSDVTIGNKDLTIDLAERKLTVSGIATPNALTIKNGIMSANINNWSVGHNSVLTLSDVELTTSHFYWATNGGVALEGTSQVDMVGDYCWLEKLTMQESCVFEVGTNAYINNYGNVANGLDVKEFLPEGYRFNAKGTRIFDQQRNEASNYVLRYRRLTDSQLTVTLNPDTYVYDGNEKKPAVTVTYDGQTLTENTSYTLTYADNKNAGTASVTIDGINSLHGQIVKNFTIQKADQNAPTGLTPTAETIDGKNDGQIANLATTMEYSVDQTSWTACTGTTLTQLSDGDYYVRYKETNNYYASPSTKVVVAKGATPSTTGGQTTEGTTTTENQTTGEQVTTQQTFVEQPDGATTQAGAPKTTETSRKTDKAVSTGDAYPIAIMITLMLGAGVGITGMIRRRKEK
jgi:hypothetical protein